MSEEKDRFFLVALQYEVDACHCNMLKCVCTKYDTKSFCMTSKHFPMKKEIFEKFRDEYHGTPIMVFSCCELPDEKTYYNFRW